MRTAAFDDGGANYLHVRRVWFKTLQDQEQRLFTRLHGVARPPRNGLTPTVSAPSVLGAKRHAFSSAHRCAASPAPALPPRVSFSPGLTSEAPLGRWEGISGVGRPPCLEPSIIQSSSYSRSLERAGSPGAAGAAGGGAGAGGGALGAGGGALGAGGTASGALASGGGAASAVGAGGCAVAVGATVAFSLAAAAGGDA